MAGLAIGVARAMVRATVGALKALRMEKESICVVRMLAS